ncbi:MAG: alpha/beta hydrolase [Proteobacteria bacterium]|nr:alpha/beta hydrolase [Pseudomonadota bacterium]
MYLITNRDLDESKTGLAIFESTPSKEGVNNLRVVKIGGKMKNPTVDVQPDVVDPVRVAQLKKLYRLDIDEGEVHYRSLEVACLLFRQARKEKKHLLFYVHGYNNDVADIIHTANALETQYKDVIVVPFSWPAKGGGALSGTANYIDDKRDARASSGALDRVFQHLRALHLMLLEAQNEDLWAECIEAHGENLVAARADFVAAQVDVCKITINLLCHSMGNYVLKYATFPGGSSIRRLIFDNVCLIAPDTNNHEHAAWVSRIEARGGVYITINENDHALQWARRKPGDEQRPRLGHYLKALNAPNATYIDVSRATGIGDQHSYFHGDVIDRNSRVKRLFQKLFTGDRPERFTSHMEYLGDLNAYRLR